MKPAKRARDPVSAWAQRPERNVWVEAGPIEERSPFLSRNGSGFVGIDSYTRA